MSSTYEALRANSRVLPALTTTSLGGGGGGGPVIPERSKSLHARGVLVPQTTVGVQQQQQATLQQQQQRQQQHQHQQLLYQQASFPATQPTYTQSSKQLREVLAHALSVADGAGTEFVHPRCVPFGHTSLMHVPFPVELDKQQHRSAAQDAYNDAILLFEEIIERSDEEYLQTQRLGRHSGKGAVPKDAPARVNRLTSADRDKLIKMRKIYVDRSETLAQETGKSGHPPVATAALSRRANSAATTASSRSPPRTYEAMYDEMLSSISNAPQPVTDNSQIDFGGCSRTLAVLAALRKSMTRGSGAAITPTLGIPLALWTVPLHKVHAADAKIAACDSVAAILKPIAAHLTVVTASQTTQNSGGLPTSSSATSLASPPRIIRDFRALAGDLRTAQTQLDALRSTLVRKHKAFALDLATPSASPNVSSNSLPHTPTNTPTTATAPSTRVKHWGSKLSKSMEKLTSSRQSLQHLDVSTPLLLGDDGSGYGSTDGSREQSGGSDSPTAYRDALRRLFAAVEVLEHVHVALAATEGDPRSRPVREALEPLVLQLGSFLVTGFLRRDVLNLGVRFWKKMRKVAAT
ncbi:hypothetical protein HKX48_003457 [Thoreauomyces humboldtii]|nr:hypothetical protein HKX48_003457 [Thoreauomyces humboldtii]